MSKNILIVHSDNDKYFIEALLAHLNNKIDLKIESPICNIDDYECLDGLSEKKLKSKLEDLKSDLKNIIMKFLCKKILEFSTRQLKRLKKFSTTI